jgi:N-acetylglutamate synthase-like GNAT family acetyltransferase/2-polyprenyl-3-methyl-5-hydroxy-6-metoxy-1,4-benzoquinol methylase
MEDIRKFVEEKYAAAIRNKSCCCGGSKGGCCSSAGGKDPVTSGIYGEDVLAKLPEEVRQQSYGCGSPTSGAGIHPGEVVLDLGSGAGIDTLLASEMTGPHGRVYGLDMTDEMLETARGNAKRVGAENITYLKGTIESIPLPDESVDVILSNCVINLSPDKPEVFREAFRVLRPGGRLSVSDMVFLAPVPDAVRGNLEAWSGCVAGASVVGDLCDWMAGAGFEKVGILPERVFQFSAEEVREMFPDLSPEAVGSIDGLLASAAISARKPARPWTAGKDFQVRAAVEEDLPQLEGLLSESGLPLEGVREHLGTFLVAVADGRVIGSAGLETIPGSVLLRSVAVARAARKRRVGEALVDEALSAARRLGAESVFLLTETAADWFLRWGFEPVARETMPAALRFSSALEGICPLSSTCMKLRC